MLKKRRIEKDTVDEPFLRSQHMVFFMDFFYFFFIFTYDLFTGTFIINDLPTNYEI